MAVTTTVYDAFKFKVGKKLIDLSADTLKVALLTSSYVPSQTHAVFADVSGYEISGTGYSAGGAAIPGTLAWIQDDANTRAKLWNSTGSNASDVSWAAATFTARYAVIYDVTASNALIAYIDFGSNQSPIASTLTISWTGGIILTCT